MDPELGPFGLTANAGSCVLATGSSAGTMRTTGGELSEARPGEFASKCQPRAHRFDATARCSHTLSGRQSFMRRPGVAVRVPGALTHWVSARSVGRWPSVLTRRLAEEPPRNYMRRKRLLRQAAGYDNSSATERTTLCAQVSATGRADAGPR